MNISAESYGHSVLLHLKGELTEDSLAALRQAVDHHASGKDVVDVVLDLEQVPFVDSAAMEYVLDLQDRLAEKLGQVKLIAPDEHVRKILEITRLASAFETYADLPEALKAIHA